MTTNIPKESEYAVNIIDALPKELRGTLPAAAEIEARLTRLNEMILAFVRKICQYFLHEEKSKKA